MICQELALLSKNPQYCGKCQSAVFCHSCITAWTSAHKTCPNCREASSEMRSLVENKNLLGLLKTVQLYCRYKPRGCEEISTYDQFEEHAKECGRCRVCDKEGVIKREMFNHHLDECDKFMQRCQYCGVEGTR